MNGGLAIMVKTPGHSPVKTRLSAGLGEAFAIQWHRRAARAVAAVAGAVRSVQCYWAVAEAPASVAVDWPGLPSIGQGDGELGERMGRVHAALLERHDFGLLVGADTPQLDPEVLAQACAWLASEQPRFAMGPARDGGFWLIGGNRSPAPGDWLQVPCGRADTGQGFLAAMHHLGDWHMLPLLTDCDEPGDLLPMLAELEGLARPHQAQRELARWTRAALAGRNG